MSLSASIFLELDDFLLSSSFTTGEDNLAIVGPNGSGKSTLLKTLIGAHRPQKGFIRLKDTTWFDSQRDQFVQPEHRNIGYVPQNLALFPHLTALDNVAFGLKRSISRKHRRTQAHALLKELSCSHLALKYPGALSGGEAQRIALARSLILNPNLWLLDEPFSAIDPGSKNELRAFVVESIKRSNAPVVMVTHSLDDIKAFEAKIAIMDSGSIVQSGAPKDVVESPLNDFVAALSAVQE